jgi:hypothetical protein
VTQTISRVRWSDIDQQRACTVLAVTALWAIDPHEDVTQDWCVTAYILRLLRRQLDTQIRLRESQVAIRPVRLVLGHVVVMLMSDHIGYDAGSPDDQIAVLNRLRGFVNRLLSCQGKIRWEDVARLQRVTDLIHATDRVLQVLAARPIANPRRDRQPITAQMLSQLCRTCTT